jgi:pimeloyl-ACP methyl ester carboxylesterase
LAGGQLVPARAVTKWYFRWYDPVAASDQRTRVAIDELVEHDLLARRCFKRKKFVRPRVLSDEEWRLLRVPTLFLVGDQEVTYSAHRAVERLAAVAPDVEAKVIPHADHHLTIVAPESLATAILMFLDDDRSPET